MSEQRSGISVRASYRVGRIVCWLRGRHADGCCGYEMIDDRTTWRKITCTICGRSYEVGNKRRYEESR